MNGVMAPVLSMHVAASSDSDFIVVQTATGTYASADSGKHWRQWQLPASAGALYGIAGGCAARLLVATSRGLFQSELRTDKDLTLVPALGIPEGTVSALAVHPEICQIAYAAQFGKTYVSYDGGTNWSLLTAGGGREHHPVVYDSSKPNAAICRSFRAGPFRSGYLRGSACAHVLVTGPQTRWRGW